MTIENKKRILKRNVLVQRLDDEIIILNVKDERYFSLDKHGAIFWGAIEKNEEVGAILEELESTFEVERKLLEADLEKFIDELVDHGIVEIK